VNGPGGGPADANVGFTLASEDRLRLVRALDRIAEDLPEGCSFLIDLAGRIVDVARRPTGVTLEPIAALAAGVHASTVELAGAMEEREFRLVFEREDDRTVVVWPVAGRALLVAMLRSPDALRLLEARMKSPAGIEVEALIRSAREPMQVVPPPRVVPYDAPEEIKERMRGFSKAVLDAQARHGGELPPELAVPVLKARDELIRALEGRDWERAGKTIDEIGRRLAGG
jgi:hypothetical protein